MSDVVVIQESPNQIVVVEPALEVVEVAAGVKGDKGDNGQDAVVLYGAGLPPDPAGLPDGALYIRYTE
jgi:hypothetical protein